MPPRLPLQLAQSCCCVNARIATPQGRLTSLLLNSQSPAFARPQQPHSSPRNTAFQLRTASILSRLSDTPGAYSKRIRRGRGASSGKGKTSGRGHKGQKAHGKVPYRPSLGRHFNGGQTPNEVVHGSRGFENHFTLDLTPLNLDKLQMWIDAGRLDTTRPITVRELLLARCVSRVKDGVKLLARNKDALSSKIHIVVSRASGAAIEAIEAAGGSVQTRYYTQAAIHRVAKGQTHPTQSLLTLPAPAGQAGQATKARLSVQSLQAATAKDSTASSPIAGTPRSRSSTSYKYRLPDATSRKDLEYYRDPAHRGYLSYQLQPGQGPSLFFNTPAAVAARLKGTKLKRRKLTKGKDGKAAQGTDGKLLTGAANRIW